MTLTNYSGKQWFDWINVKIDMFCKVKLVQKHVTKMLMGENVGYNLEFFWIMFTIIPFGHTYGHIKPLDGNILI